LDLLRVKQRRRSIRLLSFDPSLRHNNIAAHTVAEIADWSSNPANEAETCEQSQVIEKSLYQLPPDQRAVVVLRDIEGLSYQEIASITGTNLGTVRSRLHYARLKLRMLLEPYLAGSQLAAAAR
jgi:RNA polymerase sigma-70 factor (ECF subfamily)